MPMRWTSTGQNLPKFPSFIGIAEGGDVVGQSIEPDVDDVPVVPGYRNPPVERRARHGKVAEAVFHEGEDFIPLGFGLDEVGIGLDMRQQPLLVFAHPEEVGFFLELFGGAVAIGAFEVDELGFGPESLAGGAVPVFILTQVNVPFLKDLGEETGYSLFVSLLCGADEIAVRDVEFFPECLEALYNPVRQFEGRFARRVGGFFHLLPVLVSAGEEEHLEPLEALVARQHVGCKGGVGMTYVGDVVDIIYGGGYIKGTAHRFSFSQGSCSTYQAEQIRAFSGPCRHSDAPCGLCRSPGTGPAVPLSGVLLPDWAPLLSALF